MVPNRVFRLINLSFEVLIYIMPKHDCISGSCTQEPFILNPYARNIALHGQDKSLFAYPAVVVKASDKLVPRARMSLD